MAKKEEIQDSEAQAYHHGRLKEALKTCLLYTSDAADE